jgi:hypothetical protein
LNEKGLSKLSKNAIDEIIIESNSNLDDLIKNITNPFLKRNKI